MLKIQNLSISYQKQGQLVPAVRGVSFNIQPGKVLGLAGESGCGKSSIALAILRLLDEKLSNITGSIQLDEQEILTLPQKSLRTLRGGKIGFVFQDPFTSFNPVLTLGLQVEETIKAHQNLTDKQVKNRVLELFDLVKLPDPQRIYQSYPHQVSGGQRQRVMIATAIANRPALLIADEPTTALDTTVQKEIMELLMNLKKEFNMAVLFVTHNLALLANYADDILILYGGQTAEFANAKTIINYPKHPYTQGLLKAIPGRNSSSLKQKLFAIEGAPPDPKELPSGCIFYPRCVKMQERCKQEVPQLVQGCACFYPEKI